MGSELQIEQGMNRLKELTQTLEFPFANTIHSTTAEEIAFNMESGTMRAYRMKQNKYYASVLVTDSCGAVFPLHSHKEKEYIIVIEGWIEIHKYDGNVSRHEAGEVGMIPADTIHKCVMMDGSVLLVITIPPAKEF